MQSLPAEMTAVAIQGKGGPEVLVPERRPVPRPTGREVLIKVAAAGVNRPDVLQRQGLYPAPKGHSEIPGLEVAGTVVAAGPEAAHLKDGSRVMALVNGGGYAEYCLAEEGSVLEIPAQLGDIEAACLPETAFTVWHNVFERGGLKSGEWFLVHGGTSGIGVMAIQLAKAFGARVMTTAGSDEKCAAAKALGADIAVNYRTADYGDVAKEATGGRGIDVILDMVGGDYIDKNIRALADDGRLVNIGFQSGSKASLDLMRVMLKRLTLTGSTLRIRSSDVKARIAGAVGTNVLPLVADGRLKVPVDSVFAIADAASAHRRMESSQHIGKIALRV
ncbi:MAG: NAD(P)H-quinone oxidoreductase [Hyphomicrobium sp.]|nr:NAD(P)H-quinone oxidoreductase [Hyphomicrobium sp.]